MTSVFALYLYVKMSVILKHFQKVVSGEERTSCPRQIIAVGSRWSAGIEALVREHMIYPSIIITVMEEAALYGRVHQVSLHKLLSYFSTALFEL